MKKCIRCQVVISKKLRPGGARGPGPGARPALPRCPQVWAAALARGPARCPRPRPLWLTSLFEVLSQDLSPDPPPLTWTSSADGTEVVSAAPAPGPPRQLVEELQSRYRQMEERITCPICIDSHIRLVFQCGHGACAPCGAALSACPICRQPIRDRIQIFV